MKAEQARNMTNANRRTESEGAVREIEDRVVQTAKRGYSAVDVEKIADKLSPAVKSVVRAYFEHEGFKWSEHYDQRDHSSSVTVSW